MKDYKAKEIVNNIRRQVSASNEKAISALMKIYSQQTKTEASRNSTECVNNLGFNKPHACQMSILAKKIRRNERLSYEEMDKVRIVIPHYSNQLFKLAVKSGIYTKTGNGKSTRYQIVKV